MVYWSPYDISAKKLLAPWFRVVHKNKWIHIILISILPKLLFSLKKIDVSTIEKGKAVDWFFSWAELIP